MFLFYNSNVTYRVHTHTCAYTLHTSNSLWGWPKTWLFLCLSFSLSFTETHTATGNIIKTQLQKGFEWWQLIWTTCCSWMLHRSCLFLKTHDGKPLIRLKWNGREQCPKFIQAATPVRSICCLLVPFYYDMIRISFPGFQRVHGNTFSSKLCYIQDCEQYTPHHKTLQKRCFVYHSKIALRINYSTFYDT